MSDINSSNHVFCDHNTQIFRATEAQIDSSKSGKKMVLKNVLLDVINAETANGTLYSWSDMKPGLEKLSEMISRNQGYFYVDHPTPEAENVPMQKNSHNLIQRIGARVTALNYILPSNPDIEAFEVRCDINIINTGSGKDVRACLEDGGGIGFSKRGMLSDWIAEDKGVNIVQRPNNYQFEGYDIVIGQSVEGAEIQQEQIAYEQEINQTTNNNVMEDLEMDWKEITSLEVLKANAPATVYEMLVTEAKELVSKTAITEAQVVEREKAAVDAAIKPLNETITTQTAQIGKQEKAFEAILPALVDAGVVDDREPSQVEKDLQTQVESLTGEKAKLVEEKTALENVVPTADAIDTPEKVAEAVKTELPDDNPVAKAVTESMSGMSFANKVEFKRAFENTVKMAESLKGLSTTTGETEDVNASDEEKQKVADAKRALEAGNSSDTPTLEQRQAFARECGAVVPTE